MARVKHSKFKNIGILYELLARQLTSDVLRDKKDGVAVDILKEYCKIRIFYYKKRK